MAKGSFLFHSTLKCKLHLSYEGIQSLTRCCFRSHATCRRTFYDLYHMFDVLCNFLLLSIPHLQTSISIQLDILVCIHNGEHAFVRPHILQSFMLK